MYGGYREAKKTLDEANPSARHTATTNTNRLRSLRSLSGITQPVRTKDLLDDLREVYDDVDNSASKRAANPPENDPAISWDKQSFPKGLEWMTPAPCKSKASNTIPETVGSLNIRDVGRSRAGWLASNESLNSSSASSTDKSNAASDNVKTRDSNVAMPTPSILLNEFDKENVFRPLKAKSETQIPDPHGLLSSTKKSYHTEARSQMESYHLNTDLIHRTVQNEDLFTPLKRVKVDSAPSSNTFGHMAVNPSHKISMIPENASVDSKLSPPSDDHMHNLMSGRKSPLSMHPHMSLLTPITQIRPSHKQEVCGSAISTNKKLAFSSFPHPSDKQHSSNKQHSSKPDMDIWMTPAKGYSQISVHPQETKLTKKNDDLCSIPLEEKSKGEKNIMSSKDCQPLNILCAKSTASTGLEEIPQLGDQNRLSKMTPYTQKVQHNVYSSCLATPVSHVAPVHVSTIKAVPRSSTEMPPPSVQVHKQPDKASPESAPHAINHSIGFSMGEKKSTNEMIYVNGKSYTVLSLLGRGGSSVVYLVLEPGTSNLLAVKCVNLSELDQSTYKGYLNEIELLAQLQDSDCVIRMFDHQYCKEEKLLYVVMEKGETDLSKLIRAVSRTKKVSPAMIVYYWTEMLNAVSFIHKKGTIHSDLKPANFLLVAGRLKLIDFGIASVIQADMTSVMKDNMTGTYNYISPEALCSTGPGPDGRSVRFKISCKSDVWSLGCILYNLVYGHTPFQNITHQFAKMKAIADPKHKIPFPPAPGCPQALLNAMQACLVREPKLRPSVDDLLKYPYFGSVDPPMNDKFSGLLEQIHNVAHSNQPPSEKIMSIQSLLSTCQSSES